MPFPAITAVRSEKFLLKPQKITIFWPNFVQNWGPHGPHPKQKTIFFSEIIKPDPKLSKPFYFNKMSYVLAECECFSILCNAFLLKSAISSYNSCDFIITECMYNYHDFLFMDFHYSMYYVVVVLFNQP